jgi:hypothetical protein
LSEEHKRHISEGLYKVMGTPEMRQKISQIAKQKGIGKWMTKGVLPESIRKHLETMKPFKCEERPRQGEESRYTTWRTAVFTRDDFTCQVCGHRGGQLEAHHIKSWAKFPELRYVVSNGKTTCKEPCHKILNKEQRQNEMQLL